MLWQASLLWGGERSKHSNLSTKWGHILILYMEKTKHQFYGGFCYLQSNWTKGRTEGWHFSVTASSTWLKDLSESLLTHYNSHHCGIQGAALYFEQVLFSWVKGSDAHFPCRDVAALLCSTETTSSSGQCFTPDILQWLSPAWARCKKSKWLSSGVPPASFILHIIHSLTTNNSTIGGFRVSPLSSFGMPFTW